MLPAAHHAPAWAERGAAPRGAAAPAPRAAPRPAAAAPGRRLRCAATPDGDDPSAPSDAPSSSGAPPPLAAAAAPKSRRAADSSDPIASAITRRFGLGGGLAWAGILAFGVVSEQIKTRIEQAEEAKNTREIAVGQEAEVVLPNGLRVTDLKIGGGARPEGGLLAILDFSLRADGAVVEDTRARGGKPIVLLFGGRPLRGGICEGAEQALAGMRAGGRRRVVVPAGSALGFPDGAALRSTRHVPDKGAREGVPPGAELVYDLELLRVSVPPS
jgi:FKBP-type peptidyl-prolyl cis-trans isomerase